jgi:hypothetical protein
VLYVTATKVPDIEASQRTGSLWRVQTTTTGLELIPGTVGPASPGPGRTCAPADSTPCRTARRPC